MNEPYSWGGGGGGGGGPKKKKRGTNEGFSGEREWGMGRICKGKEK